MSHCVWTEKSLKRFLQEKKSWLDKFRMENFFIK